MSVPGDDSSRLDEAASGTASSSRLPLRPLAPKPPAQATRPVIQRTRTAPSRAITPRLSPNQCPVCSRRGCQLPTHKALIATTRIEAAGLGINNAEVAKRFSDSAYTKSYAYYYAQQLYIDRHIGAAQVDPFFDLPIPNKGQVPEMHRLFREYFTVMADAGIKVQRPPELTSDLTVSPFFVPAMTDTALCLAILAVAAAVKFSQRPDAAAAGNITVLTLVGEAMQCLRERFADDPTHATDTTILAATYLWSVNALLNDADAMRSHALSVYALVDGRGGLSNLGLMGTIAQFVRWVDLLNGMTFAEEAKYHDTAEPPPLSDPPPPVYGAFFMSTRADEILEPALNEACLESCRLVELLEHTLRTVPTTPHYLYLMATLYVHGAKTTVIQARHCNNNTMNECVCLGMSIVNMLVFYMPKEQKLLAITLSQRLIRALRQTEGILFWARDKGILSWLLVILALVPHEFEGKEWAKDLLYTLLVSRFGKDNWPQDWQGQVQQSMEQLIWSNLRLSGEFAKVCIDLRNRMSSSDHDEDDEDDKDDEDDGDE